MKMLRSIFIPWATVNLEPFNPAPPKKLQFKSFGDKKKKNSENAVCDEDEGISIMTLKAKKSEKTGDLT